MSQIRSAVAPDRPTARPGRLALLAPGQGAQKPGMLIPWLVAPDAEHQLAVWSDLCGLDLLRLGTTADADELVDTAVTQPLIVAAGLLAFRALCADGPLPVETVVAGHSVGELTAAAVAGVISADTAIFLAAARGSAMADACRSESTGMSAVLGGDTSIVIDVLDRLGLSAANRNGTGHVVAAGRIEALQQLSAVPPEGAKVVPLSVAGAFHTPFMRSAESAFAAAIDGVTVNDPWFRLLSNSDGKEVDSGADTMAKLVSQLTGPVRWDLCVESIGAASVTAAIELPPAGTLCGIARRELPSIARHPLKRPADLTALPR
ncbi:ACP S-malonyltransferase [Nocardia sp. NPDC059177]|uniref:ACP S-malonyltransferase n=1 Tax=Nocardia sp. NPDC059177 TaxID=3346759 RepID=UPI0036C2332C